MSALLRGSCIIRSACYLVATALVLASFASRARADQIEVSLNVLYDGGGPTNGGTWQIAAKCDAFGIAGLQLLLTGIDFGSEQLVAPRGFVNGTDPAGISAIDRFTHPLGFREVDVYQQPVAVLGSGEEQSIFYGIGTLTNGTPDTLLPGGYDSLTGAMNIPWAPVPPGDVLGDSAWDSGAVLVTGTFSSGMTPAFYADIGDFSSGAVYTSLGTETSVGNSTPYPFQAVMTTVRSNILPDYNQNGFVDAADYSVWRDAVAAGSTILPNDRTPGVVNEDDFLVWRDNFGAVLPGFGAGSGAGAGASLAATAVPEPASWALLLGATAMLFLQPKNTFLRNVRFP